MTLTRITPASGTARAATGGVGRAADQVSHALYSLFEAPSQVLKQGQGFKLATEQVPLAAAAGASLLYAEGQERAKPDGGDPALWAKLLTEAGLMYGLMTYTRGVLPLVGLGTLAWKLGEAGSDNSKLQNALSVAGVMTLGYLGAMLGLRYTMTVADREASKIMPLLRDARVRAFFSPGTDPELHALGAHLVSETAPVPQALRQMGEHIDQCLPAIEQSLGFLKADPLLAQTHRKKLAAALGKIHTPLAEPTLEAYLEALSQGVSEKRLQAPADSLWQARQHLMRRVRELATRLTNSQKSGYQLIRAANPVMGAMMGMMLGVSLAQGLYGLITQRVPALKSLLPGRMPAKPLWFSNPLRTESDTQMPRLSHLVAY